MKLEHTASVVAINGQTLSGEDLKQLMEALAASWLRSVSSRGAVSAVRKLYLGKDSIDDAVCVAKMYGGGGKSSCGVESRVVVMEGGIARCHVRDGGGPIYCKRVINRSLV